MRAVFWIGLVSLLIPHEPDLGFGRPSGQASLAGAVPASMAALIQANAVEGACAAAGCAGGLSILSGVHSVALRSMSEVRADLAAHKTKFRMP